MFSAGSKEELALRKQNERSHTTKLMASLQLLAPSVAENKGLPGRRSKALRGRTKEELLKDVVHAVRLVIAGRTREELLGTAKPRTHRLRAPCALEQAYTTQAGGGLIAIELTTGKIAHQSPSFQELFSWIPVEARGNIRLSLEARNFDIFQTFCQSAVKDAGEPYGDTFPDRDKVLGRSITVRFFTRAPGPPGLRNPDWLLMIRAIKLTLVGVQRGELPDAGRRPPFFGQARVPEAIGVFTADLSGGTPQQWTVQAAHVRNLLDAEVASGTYEVQAGNIKPLEKFAMLFNFELSKEEGAGASLFSRAVDYAATSALNIAQRSASWLARKALRIQTQVSMRLNHDDTVAIAFVSFFTLLSNFSVSGSMELEGGKVGFSHGGLDVLYFVADPEQPLDGNLRATSIRIASAKTPGEFDVHRPFVFSNTWGVERFQVFCKMLAFDGLVGIKMPSEKDVSPLIEKLKMSPGRGLLSDGTVTICVGQSGVQPNSPDDW